MAGGHSPDDVRATAEAKQTAADLGTFIGTTLNDTITTFETKCIFLDYPSQFNGKLACDYDANIWPQMKSALAKLREEMGDMQQWLQTNLTNIMSAGGSA